MALFSDSISIFVTNHPVHLCIYILTKYRRGSVRAEVMVDQIKENTKLLYHKSIKGFMVLFIH